MQFIVDFQVGELVVGGVIDDFCVQVGQCLRIDCVFQCIGCEDVGVDVVDVVGFDCFGVVFGDCVFYLVVVQIGYEQFGFMVVQQFDQFYVDMV